MGSMTLAALIVGSAYSLVFVYAVLKALRIDRVTRPHRSPPPRLGVDIRKNCWVVLPPHGDVR